MSSYRLWRKTNSGVSMIVVVGREEVDEALETGDFTHVISIGTPSLGVLLWEGSRFWAQFDDVEQHMPRFGYEGITEEQAGKLAEHLIQVDPSEGVLIHCAAGVSRSSAVALCLLALQEPVGDEALAVQKLKTVLRDSERGGYRMPDIPFRPNRRVVYFVDQITGMGGRLLRALEEAYYPEKEPFRITA